MSSRKEAFALYSAKLKNLQSSWSAQREDGAIVLAIWRDECNYETKPPSCALSVPDGDTEWHLRPGAQERATFLKQARDEYDGEFFIVMQQAEVPMAHPRKVARCHAATNMRGRLTELNEETGYFEADLISPDQATKLPAL